MTTITVFIYEMKRLSRSWMNLLIAIATPVLLITVLSLALDGSIHAQDETIKQAEVVIYSEDEGVIYDKLQAYLESGSVRPYILPVYTDSMAYMEERLRLGEAHLGIVIPENFTRTILQNKHAEWTLYPGTGLSKNITAQGLVQVFLERVNFNRSGLSEASVDPKNTDHENLSASLDNGRGQITLERVEEFSIVQYFSVHILIMFIFYTGLLLAVNMLYDRQHDLLERFKGMPIAPLQVVVGKMLAFLVLSGLQSAIIIVLSATLFNVYWGERHLLLALACLLTILIAMSLAFIIMLFVKSVGGVAAIFNAIVLISTFIAGSFYPTAGGWLEKVSKLTLNEWASNVMFSIMLHSDGEVVWRHMSILSLTAVIFFLIAFLSFRSRFFLKE